MPNSARLVLCAAAVALSSCAPAGLDVPPSASAPSATATGTQGRYWCADASGSIAPCPDAGIAARAAPVVSAEAPLPLRLYRQDVLSGALVWGSPYPGSGYFELQFDGPGAFSGFSAEPYGMAALVTLDGAVQACREKIAACAADGAARQDCG